MSVRSERPAVAHRVEEASRPVRRCVRARRAPRASPARTRETRVSLSKMWSIVKLRLERADDPRRQADALVVGRGPRHRRRQAALVPVNQMAWRRERAQQRQRFGVPRAEVLGHVVVEVHAHRHRPAHGGRRHAAGANQPGQRRHLDVARVPVPGAGRTALGVEPGVVDDAVDGRGHAGDHRGVRRIGDGGEHADDAARVCAARRQRAQRRDLCRSRRGVARGAHAVD